VFDTDQFGRLRYAPFRYYQLPELFRVDDGAAEFARRHGDTDEDGFGPPMFRRPRFRLRWPGENTKDVQLPAHYIEKLDWWPRKADQSHYGIREFHEEWVEAGRPLIHEALAYHMAVNPAHLCDWAVDVPKQPRPRVCGLPPDRVDQVLDAEFAIDEKAFATLTFLRWRAESDYMHPLLRGFDTNVRETLSEMQHETVRMFFYLLSDYRYDAQARWWDRGLEKFVWQRLATYLHWVGRTGRGLYGTFAHIDPPGIRQDVVETYMQDVVAMERDWIHSNDQVADVRTVAADEDVTGPAL